ncbi:MobA/MobL family protein [Ruminococcus albus]|uniref:MobA/MobL family protein n=2 Tax=Ruminococcus albus TaxID=1264 RepID=A0A1H7PW50_RUMAL|nr:MobA/MobL family protein [Ruminococcus albus]
MTNANIRAIIYYTIERMCILRLIQIERRLITAIYHFNVKMVTRTSGGSCVASAAYIAGEKIKNERDGKMHDYRNKHEVVHKEILLQKSAPSEYSSRAKLWNAAECAEKRKNSQTARSINAALPRELSREDQIDLVRQFCKQCFVSKGMCCDFAIHDKGDGNPHVHILLTTRRVDKNGFTQKERTWNDRKLLLEWRERWADWCNHKLYFVSDARVDHRSYKDQGIDRLPQIHMGVEVCAVERKGFKTDKGNKNRRIRQRNLEVEIAELENEIKALKRERRQSLVDNIEQQLGCPLADTQHISGNYADMERYSNHLQANHVPCEFNIYENGKSELFFRKSDTDKALMLVNQLRQNNLKRDNQANTQQKSAQPKKSKPRL